MADVVFHMQSSPELAVVVEGAAGQTTATTTEPSKRVLLDQSSFDASIDAAVASPLCKKQTTSSRRQPAAPAGGFCDNGNVRLSSLATCHQCTNYYRGNADHSSTVNAAFYAVSGGGGGGSASQELVSADRMGPPPPTLPWRTSPSGGGTPTCCVQVPPESWLICLSEVLNSFHQSTLMELCVKDLCSTLKKRFIIAVSPPPPVVGVVVDGLKDAAMATTGTSGEQAVRPDEGEKEEASTMGSRGEHEQQRCYSITATRGLCLSIGAQRMLRANLPARDKQMLLRRQPLQNNNRGLSNNGEGRIIGKVCE
eukprot:GHVS01072517.1.p1 GENE.GHVS01072517.1~~GHVS01072517.1.p1  ORF type:complete len:334 (-),score=69.57 GHVS01072517.1:359-1288(-)